MCAWDIYVWTDERKREKVFKKDYMANRKRSESLVFIWLEDTSADYMRSQILCHTLFAFRFPPFPLSFLFFFFALFLVFFFSIFFKKDTNANFFPLCSHLIQHLSISSSGDEDWRLYGLRRVDEIDIRRLIVERSKKRSERNTQYIQYILHAWTTTTLYKEFKEY